MKNSKSLLLDYLTSVRDPERAASLFADDGVFELPFLRSLGVESRYTGRGEITALMPGKILRIEVKVGDTVAEKQTVAIMESMKMESALHAPKAGRVAAIHCQPGQVVEMGELLIVIG